MLLRARSLLVSSYQRKNRRTAFKSRARNVDLGTFFLRGDGGGEGAGEGRAEENRSVRERITRNSRRELSSRCPIMRARIAFNSFARFKNLKSARSLRTFTAGIFLPARLDPPWVCVCVCVCTRVYMCDRTLLFLFFSIFAAFALPFICFQKNK